MADTKVSRLPFELKDVTGFWTAIVALVGLGMAVALAWFLAADSGVERSVAGGGLFLLIVAGLLVIAFRAPERTASAAPATGGLDPSNVRQGASAEQIQAPQGDELPAPDGSYLIAGPPDGWQIDERDFADLLRDENRANFGTDQSPFQPPAMTARAGLARVFRAPNAVTTMSRGARTKVHGRPGFTWLGGEMRSELYVIPLEREQPPHFVDFPFPHMAVQRVLGTLGTGFVLQSLTFGRLERGGAPVMVAESTLTLEDLLVDDRPVSTLRRINRLVVTRGDVRDYAIAFADYSYEGEGRSYAGEFETMQRILASFRPYKPANAPAKRAERKREADVAFEAFMAAHGREFFYAQLQFALQRVAAKGLATPRAVDEAVTVLRPFRDGADGFAASPGFEQRTTMLWEAFDSAAAGDPALLRAWMPLGFGPGPQPPRAPAGATEPPAGLPAPGL